MSSDLKKVNRELLEVFIRAYQSQPCLWRIKSQDYHDKVKKDAAYVTLLNKYRLIDNTADKDAVVKKINAFRTNYRREKKKVETSRRSGVGTDEIYEPSLWYYHLFEFLEDQETPRSSSSNFNEGEASRKIAKCGYLFVAPGWDFTNPLNRTKRWQRRWFVLYDDGELSYSLDEHPETVPQASIDMNKVLEVADAEDITGNPFSLAITAPDNVHFVKGTCREEARWWSDVLSVFPRSKGRHKRNATFPGGQSTSSAPTLLQSKSVRGSSEVCPRYNSCHLSGTVWEGQDVFPTRDMSSLQNSLVDSSIPSVDNRKVYMGSPPTRDKVRTEEKSRTRRVQNREKRGLKTGRSFSEDLTKMLPTWRDKKSAPSPVVSEHPEMSRRLLLEEYESECKLKDIADSITRPRHRRMTSPAVSPPPGKANINQEPTHDIDTSTHKQVRGDPDGCGLDLSILRYSPTSELRVELPAEDLLNIKKGWLMKQGIEKEFNKHWFVLRGAALLYYRDPAAEDQGILDGVIDLNGVSDVSEVQVARNYGFKTTTWDDHYYVLSAVTAGIRANWMAAIRRAAGLDVTSKVDTTSVQMDRERDVSTMPSTPRSVLFSSDDEYRTASEGGRRESGDWGDTLPPSPPLNRTPISKVKERARGGSRSRAYSNSKRSRSSPPSSRYSTLDSVHHDEFVLACCGELPESDVEDISFNSASQSISLDSKSFLDRVQGQATELEEVKHQLTSVLRELSNAEEELLRLRQHKSDVNALEKQIEELLQRVEEANKQQARDAVELESIKKRYGDDKARWEQEMNKAEHELQLASERYSQLCIELADNAKLVQRLREELSNSDDLIMRLKNELESVTNRLAIGIEENEALYRRLRELESRGGSTVHSSMREKARSVDSLSDLTNIDLDLDVMQLDKDRIVEEYEDLRVRFEKAVAEIRAMKRELRESHAQTDCLELSLINARQDLKCKQEAAEAQTSLMAARIQDLALKLSNAEKQIRALKQKLSKTETREKRRSLSLKGREAFTISKEIEEKLTELENKISKFDCSSVCTTSAKDRRIISLPSPSPDVSATDTVSARLRRKSLDSATSSEPMKVLLRLRSLDSKVAKLSKDDIVCCHSPSLCEHSSLSSSLPSNDVNVCTDSSVQKNPVELKLLGCFQDETDGILSQQKLQVVSEVKKMENLLRSKLLEISKKRESFISSGQWNNETRISLLAEKLAYESVLIGRLHDAVSGSSRTDIIDSERLISELDDKLSGSKPNIETSLDYLTRRLSRYLLEQNDEHIKPRKVKERKRAVETQAIKELLRKKIVVDSKVSTFLDEVTDHLATVFAAETVGDDYESMCEKRIKSTWTLAQEAVNQELIQAEISQVMIQCCRRYENIIEDECKSRFSDIIKERATLELWSTNAQELLRRQMESNVKMLYDKYQENVCKLKSQKTSWLKQNDDEEEKSRLLLGKFVDIIAHKSLLDARLSVVNEDECSIDINSCYTDGEFVYDENLFLCEIQKLYLKYCEELQHSKEGTDYKERLSEAVDYLIKEVSVLRTYILELGKKATDSVVCPELEIPCTKNDTNWIEIVCEKCVALKEVIIKLQAFVTKLHECQRCAYLQEEIKRRELQHEEEVNILKLHHKQEVTSLQTDLELQRENLVCQHEQEQAVLKERARKLERRLGTLDSEYTQQMDNLRAAYHKTLSTTLDRDLQGEENIRQRYQAEIEHLRALCEKGLIGMENSHRRIIAELEEKHRQELEALRLEKEQALAEETQATLAALDAMRKAHEAEVQKEITKFKTEFIKKMQSTHDIGALHREHEAEMEEIKKEILSLSEKYSVKCVESAALEEELRVANGQLAQAQQHIMQLDSRNKQLRAHLVAEASDIPLDSQLLRHEKEIIKQPEQQTCHGERLNVLNIASQEKPVTGKAVVTALALVDKLKIAARNHYNSGTGHHTAQSCMKKFSKLEPSSLHKAELTRYPNIPYGRNVLPLRSPSPCTLSGMVAERKKIFEQ